MLNFIPKSRACTSLLYGKRPLQRIACGRHEQHIEIPLAVTDDVTTSVDERTSYLGNKYHALPWKKYVSIKVDAANLIDSNVKSALQNLHIYDGLAAMYCGEKTVVETTMAKGLAEATKDVKLPVA